MTDWLIDHPACRGANLSQKKKGPTRTSLGYQEAATSKRICRYKAITKELKYARTKCNHKANAERKQATNVRIIK